MRAPFTGKTITQTEAGLRALNQALKQRVQALKQCVQALKQRVEDAAR
jgi:hypothetical protein